MCKRRVCGWVRWVGATAGSRSHERIVFSLSDPLSSPPPRLSIRSPQRGPPRSYFGGEVGRNGWVFRKLLETQVFRERAGRMGVWEGFAASGGDRGYREHNPPLGFPRTDAILRGRELNPGLPRDRRKY